MSVLHRRLTTGNTTTPLRPHGTAATPMVMPLAKVDYDGTGTLTYDDLHPLATGDVNGAPMAATTPGTWGRVVPAGRP